MKLLSTTLTETDAWGEPTTITVTWLPEKITSCDGHPLHADRPTWAHATVDDPPVSLFRDRNSGCVRWAPYRWGYAGDVAAVTEFTEVSKVSDVAPGTYHVREVVSV